MINNKPFLYHGSGYLHNELKPGFKHSGKIIRWDVTESNKWLYASTELEVVKQLGFSSAVAQRWNLKEFHSDKKSLSFIFPPGVEVSLEEIYELDVYIYTIIPSTEDNWIKNTNEHNHLDSEWKTTNTVKNIKSIEKLDIKNWLKKYKIDIE